jgi:ATP-dependent RNA helicase DDX27
MKAAELHGNLCQRERLEALELFRDKTVDFLLATDLASRGIDIPGIKTVINFDMPTNYSLYVHRVGRTARAGLAGRAVSLVQESDRRVLKMAIKNAGPQSSIKNRVIPASVVSKYEAKINGLDESIKNVAAMDEQEGMLKTVEMRVDRATNMLKHSAEIKARPRKEWFQSAKQTAAGNKEAPRNHVKDKKRGALDGLSRKKKRKRADFEEDNKGEIKNQGFAARSQKSAMKPKRVTDGSEGTGRQGRPKTRGGAGRVKKGGNFDSEVKGKRGKR